MFTRVQTIYLFLALLFLCLGLFTTTIFSFKSEIKQESKLDFSITGFSVAYKIAKPIATISDDHLQALRDQPDSKLLVENNVFNWNGVRRHWFFAPGIAALLILIMGFINYKKPSVQLKFVRIALLMGIVLLILMIFAAKLQDVFVGFSNDFNLLEKTKLNLHLGLGYFFLVLHVPFIFLAQISIKRDKKLLDSLNRLR